ncbi:MAG: MFS transporter [Arachnia propionica]|nr:MAG: MFS transporter [Arachnia propionica]
MNNRWRALGVLAFGLGLVILDGTIVGVSLPAILADLNLSLTEGQWINSLYSVVFAALLLVAGWLGDRVGRRTVFLAGLLILGIGSALAGLAADAGLLIAARAVQGVGGSLVLPSSLSTTSSMFRGRERAVAFGIWGSVMSGMAAIGPLLGGWITGAYSWPLIFWINVPLVVGLVILALLWVPQTGGGAKPGFDVVGLLLGGLGAGAVVFGLIEATSLGWWQPKAPLVIGGWQWAAPVSAVPIFIAGGLLLLSVFGWWELRRAHRGLSVLLHIELFRLPSFRWGNLAGVLIFAGEFGLIFVLPLFLIRAGGLSPIQAGLVLSALAVGALVAGLSARMLADWLGTVRLIRLGLALEVVGVLLAFVLLGFGPLLLAAALVIYGVGLGLASAQLTSTVLAQVPLELMGSASGTQSTLRQLGSALGVAFSGGVLGSFVGDEVMTAPVAAFSAGAQTAIAGASLLLAVGFGVTLLLPRDVDLVESANPA